jgi:hypothetical protein
VQLAKEVFKLDIACDKLLSEMYCPHLRILSISSVRLLDPEDEGTVIL